MDEVYIYGLALTIFLVLPHTHQPEDFITPPKQEDYAFSPEVANFLVLGVFVFLSLMAMWRYPMPIKLRFLITSHNENFMQR
ncbi:hypothetical protein CN947_15620 [Bacillus cereus]|nr:hypothetical protein CN947_15620 [Bacillus cereus]